MSTKTILIVAGVAAIAYYLWSKRTPTAAAAATAAGGPTPNPIITAIGAQAGNAVVAGVDYAANIFQGSSPTQS